MSEPCDFGAQAMETTLPTRNEEIVARYAEPLRELGTLKYDRNAPDLLLPASKEEIRAALSASEIPGKERLLQTLDAFDSRPSTLQLFCARLVLKPGVTAFAYAVAVTVAGGASWKWVLSAALAFIGGFFATAPQLILLDPLRRFGLSDRVDRLGRVRRHMMWLGLALAEMVSVGCWGAIWFRMVIYSGFYGLYFSAFSQFSLLGLAQAALALVMGWIFSKQFNAMFSSW